MRNLLFLFCFPLFILSKSQATKTSIIGKINKSVPDNTKLLIYDRKKTDTIIIRNNTFTLNKIINYPTELTLRSLIYDQKKFLTFYLDPGTNAYIDLDIDNFSLSKVKSGKSERENQLFMEKTKEIRANFQEVYSRFQNNIRQRNEATDSIKKKELQVVIDSLEEKVLEPIYVKQTLIWLDFVKENPQSFVSIYRLLTTTKSRVALPFMDQQVQLYNQLSEKIKKSPIGINVKENLQNYSESNIGAQAPDFTLKDYQNKIIKLSDSKGKYVLLDFWASWCIPCLEEFPALKEHYQKYSPHLEIIGISRDEDLEKWRRALSKYEVNRWKQVSLVENKDKNVEKTYFVSAIPVKVLINPEGKIIARWRGYSKESSKELEELLKQFLHD
ncbi:TlpA disulfide reductase family protein [Elizabethkingia anophelis]|uniref:TlpA disulfide reductase family protein n=1 Tax=Elizabethkingia anophelis TaxID=1117645 RepID=UPI00063BD9A8|nr:TlpA disulfide reductase family protein [Elizabethkingia anophelis]AKH95250.1 hypothetical protein M876_11795 [Elizabethkingia anophelis FMS-007]